MLMQLYDFFFLCVCFILISFPNCIIVFFNTCFKVPACFTYKLIHNLYMEFYKCHTGRNIALIAHKYGLYCGRVFLTFFDIKFMNYIYDILCQ